MRIYADIDGTICTVTEDANYNTAMPIYDNISILNKLYEKGHRIIYWTPIVTGKQIGRAHV